MNTISKHLWQVAALTAIATTTGVSAIAEQDTPSIVQDQRDIVAYVEPIPEFPSKLLRKGITSGRAMVSINVDEYGHLIDWLVIEATDTELAKAIDDVIEYWFFEPALENGIPITAVQIFPIYFNATKAMQAHKAESFTDFHNRFSTERATRGTRGSRRTRELKFANFAELDRMPMLLEQASPALSEELYENSLGSNVVFSFYVDFEGRVRMPTIRSIEGNIELDAIKAAQIALERWRFVPFKSDGRPAITRLAQKFKFGASLALANYE